MSSISIFLLGALLLPSCGLVKNKNQTVVTNPNIRLSGRVQSVNKDSKFVLIRRYRSWKVDEGQVVESRGDGRTANLVPTGEKLGEHVAADIRSGEVEVGDAVYIRRIKAKGESELLTTSNTPTLSNDSTALKVAPPTSAANQAPAPVEPALPPLPPVTPTEQEDQL